MLMSKLLLRTQKHNAVEAELPGHQLLLRAGLVRRLAAGIYSLTPLAYKVVRNIECIIRAEMEHIGGQETLLPVAHPAELWQESNRYEMIDQSLARFCDRNDHPMVLAMTHEEAMTDLVRAFVNSYRQLPLLLFQMQTKFRDEARPRGGLIRLREFLMKDAYSYHTDEEDLQTCYEQVVGAYRRIFHRAGIPILVVESDTGLMGGQEAHEFMLLNENGEDTLLVCPLCGYAANQEVAVAQKAVDRPMELSSQLQPLAPIHTPDISSIADLSRFLHCDPQQVLKSVFYRTGDELVVALVRGDLEVSVTKLSGLLGNQVTSLSSTEAETLGLTVGFTGPVGLQTQCRVTLVADDSVVTATNLIAGANRPNYHLLGVNYQRDFTADIIGDIAQFTLGASCVQCGGKLEAKRGIEVGNTFKLGTKYTQAMGALYTDEAGVAKPMVMGCYGIGITRLLACIVEQNYDADGIKWPITVAPYKFHILAAGKSVEAVEAANQLYTELGENLVLYDDRDLSIGVKLKDADLLGMPIRITVSDRSLAAGGAELRLRDTGETQVTSISHAVIEAIQLAESLLERDCRQ